MKSSILLIYVLSILALSQISFGALIFAEPFDEANYTLNGWVKGSPPGLVDISGGAYRTMTPGYGSDNSVLLNYELNNDIVWSNGFRIEVETRITSQTFLNYIGVWLVNNWTNEEPLADAIGVTLSENSFNDGNYYANIVAFGSCSATDQTRYFIGDSTYVIGNDLSYTLVYNQTEGVLYLYENNSLIVSSAASCSNMDDLVLAVMPRWEDEDVNSIDVYDFSIEDDNDAPVISSCSINDASLDCGESSTLTCTVVDPNLDTVMIGITNDDAAEEGFNPGGDLYQRQWFNTMESTQSHQFWISANDTFGNEVNYTDISLGFVEACSYCTESWSCIAWASCNNELRACTTVEDANDCGSLFIGNMSLYDRTCSETGGANTFAYCTPEGECFASLEAYEDSKAPTLFAGGNLETSNPFKRFWNWLVSAIWPGEAFP